MNHEKSQELFEMAKAVTPGGVHSPVRAFGHVGGAPVYFVSGEGPFLNDVDGNRYIDFCLSFGPLILGHCPPKVVGVIKEQAGLALTLGACHPREVELSSRILKHYPYLDKVRLVNSGTEAAMTAVRIARGKTGRSKLLKFSGCYHGHSDALLAKAGSGVAALTEASSQGVPSKTVEQTLVADYGDLDSVRKILQEEDVAAVICEPIPANHGLWVPPRSHLAALVEMAREVGTLIIFDEVISGFRVGFAGASGYYDLKPDLVVLGKIIGGGLPLAAVAGRAQCMDVLAPLGQVYQAGTLSSNPLATAAGCAVLETLESEPPYAALAERTQKFCAQLEGILKRRFEIRIPSFASMFWLQMESNEGNFPVPLGEKTLTQFADLFHRALGVGVYFAPSPYEVGFLSTAHSQDILDLALERLESCIR